MNRLLFLLALPLAAQQVTLSEQPVRYLLPTVGNIGVYSAEICSSPGVTVSGSWGQIRQIAEIGGINVLDSVLVGPTAQVAEARTRTHKIVVGAGIIGLSALFAAAFHQPPPWLIEGAATLTGGAQVLGNYFAQNESKIQATINTALAAVADPTAQFSVSNGACTVSRMFLGDYKANFVPIKAMLGSTAGVPSSVVPTTYTLLNTTGFTSTLSDSAKTAFPVTWGIPTGEVTESDYRSPAQDLADDRESVEMLIPVALVAVR